MTRNSLLEPSDAPFGAPRFDNFKTEDFLPAVEYALSEAKKEIDVITSNNCPPTFDNTVRALEYSGELLNSVGEIFFNLLEAAGGPQMEEIAREVSPLFTEFGTYVSLNEALFTRVSAVWKQRDALGLTKSEMKLLDDCYRGFVRGGALLADEDKILYKEYSEKLALLEIDFGANVLAATNAYKLHIYDPNDLDGLPDYVISAAAVSSGVESEAACCDAGTSGDVEKASGNEAGASENGKETCDSESIVAGNGEGASGDSKGWIFTLDRPSYSAFMKFSTRRNLREKLYKAYCGRCCGGGNDNSAIIAEILKIRSLLASLLGCSSYAQYALEDRMAHDPQTVWSFLNELETATLPFVQKELDQLTAFAIRRGFEGDCIQPWDFAYYSELLRKEKFAISDEELKPYFPLDGVLSAVFDLAGRLYGLSFSRLENVPVYEKDVQVYDVKDENGDHLSLLYMDFHPRANKRGGAWMTEFRGQRVDVNGNDVRPFISIVTNFTPAVGQVPSLLTHEEVVTLLHEFGHALHGMLSKVVFPSQAGTSVVRDFVELPSQIMEHWAYEKEWLCSFAKHYITGEQIPDTLVERIWTARNFQSGYLQLRQLSFGLVDMFWHGQSRTEWPENIDSSVIEDMERIALKDVQVLPAVSGTAVSPSFIHIFSGGYAAGYYSYKWAEVLDADAFALFKENGLFDSETASSFRRNILEKGGSEDASVLYRNFRGRDPHIQALMENLGLIQQ